ncbi:OmpA family protein [Massilia eburnea]|nr:OmpA family protein [Massilia eburnea]
MKTIVMRRSARVSAFGLAACLGVVSGCGTFATRHEPQLSPRHEFSGVIIDRTYDIRQVGTRDAAYFARCIQPACPHVTPKTIAVISQAPQEPAAGTATAASAAESEKPSRAPAETAVVHFATGSAGLDRQAQATLAQFAAIARESQRIVVSGRTDNTGGDDVNRRLANARARAVASYLRRKGGATQGRIEFDAQGRCCYAAANEAEAGRQLNRRAEVSFFQALRSAQ